MQVTLHGLRSKGKLCTENGLKECKAKAKMADTEAIKQTITQAAVEAAKTKW